MLVERYRLVDDRRRMDSHHHERTERGVFLLSELLLHDAITSSITIFDDIPPLSLADFFKFTFFGAIFGPN